MHIRRILIGCLIPLLLLSACGPSAPATSNSAAPSAETASVPVTSGSESTIDGLPPVDPTLVTGAIDITGSSTVFPLTAAVAEAFAADGSPADVDIKVTGTGAGFQRFCSGDEEVDIVNASRPINAEEQAACEAQGHSPTAFHVGTDALAVVVNVDNDFVEALTFAQLAQIFSGAVTTWSELDPTYPDQPIALFSPGTDSGTFDFFVDAVFDGDDQPIQQAPGIVLSEDDFELVSGIAENPYAIGYFGFAYYQANQDVLNVVAIDGGSGTAVVPSEATALDGTYPLARPLYIYSSADILQERPAIAAFINYYLQNVSDIVEEVGYFPVAPEALADARQTFLEVTR